MRKTGWRVARSVLGGMHTLVRTAAQIIRAGNVKLPQIVRFPGSHRLGIHSLDVRISHQAKHLEALRRPDSLRERLYICRVENIATHCRRHLEMAPDQI